MDKHFTRTRAMAKERKHKARRPFNNAFWYTVDLTCFSIGAIWHIGDDLCNIGWNLLKGTGSLAWTGCKISWAFASDVLATDVYIETLMNVDVDYDNDEENYRTVIDVEFKEIV